MSLPIYQRVAVTDAGDVIPGAEYTVINENTGVAAPIYSDRTGATLLTAPYFADSAGTIQFFIAQGTTFRVAASGGVGTYTDRYVYAAHPQSSATDTTAGSLMAVGAFGIGGNSVFIDTAGDFNNVLVNGNYHFNGTQAQAITSNLPDMGITGSAPVHFNVTVSGQSTRTTQVSTEVFGQGGDPKGQTFTRVKHDATWSSWIATDPQAFGLGSVAVSYNGGDWNDIVSTSFSLGINRLNSPLPLDKWLYVVHIQAFDSGSGYSTQTAYSLDGGLKQWQRHNTNGTWQPWIENYSTANAVGTVNYNSGAGVSDGALFEQYSSGDVRVTKFTDGTMIQRQISTIAVAIVLTPSSGGFYFNDFAIGYPEAFVGEPSLSNTSSSTSTVTIPNVTGAPTQTVANLRFVTVSSATINHRIGFTAIGRWF